MHSNVSGQHLAVVVHATSFSNCERIREFHCKLHDTPAKGESVIEATKVTAAGEKE